jgi:hypothetical protein
MENNPIYKAFKSLDIYAPQVRQFTHKRQSQEKTAIGGICTLIILGFCIVNGVLLLIHHFGSPYFTVDLQGNYTAIRMRSVLPVASIGTNDDTSLTANSSYDISPAIYRAN